MRREHPSRSPLMVRYFPSLSRGIDIHPNMRMFTEDVHLGIIPIGYRHEMNKEYKVILHNSEGEENSIKNIFSSLSKYDHHYEMTEFVEDAIGNIASILANFGNAYFEIINDNKDPFCPYLFWFTSARLIRIPKYYIQMIPKEEHDRIGRKISLIKTKNVWKITMPTLLGGERNYINILKSLKKTNSIVPNFAKKDMNAIYSTSGFDVKLYNRNHDILINQLTRTWGWNRRDTRNEICNEFYTVYKHICSAYSKAILREHIVLKLNELFKRLDLNTTLEITGLPNASEIHKTRDDLICGKIDFDKAFKSVSIY